MEFALKLPGEVLFGRGAAAKLPEIAARFGRRVFLVTGARSLRQPPAFADAVRWAVSGEPDLATADEAARRCREAGCEVVVGIGGGSALDAAKAVSALATNPGPALSFLEEVGDGRSLQRPSLPLIAVPTTAGSGSEATRNAVLRVPERGVKRSLRHDMLLPKVAVVDPALAAGAPLSVAAPAGLDALTHLLEGYVSTGAQPTTDALARPGLGLAARALRDLADGKGVTEDLCLAAFWGGVVLANAGLGAIHGLVAPLGGRKAIPHGAGCAALLAATIRTNVAALRARAPGSPALARYDAIASELPDLQSLIRRLGILPLAHYGVTRADFASIIQASRAGSMRYNPIELSDMELEAILSQSSQAGL